MWAYDMLCNRGDPALIKWFGGFDSRLVLGPVIPKTFKMEIVMKNYKVF